MPGASVGPVPGRFGLFTGASVWSRTFEALVAIAAIALGIYLAIRLPARASPLTTWPVILITTAAGIAAVAPGGLFVVSTGHKTYGNPGSGAAFALLLTLPLSQALQIALAGMLAAQLLRRYARRDRLTWQTIAFNLAQYAVSWALTGATFARVRLNLGGWPAMAGWTAATCCAGLVYILLNTWLVAVHNALRRRGTSWDLWVDTRSRLVSVEWIPLGVGAISARIGGGHPVLGLGAIALGWVAYWAASHADHARLGAATSAFAAMIEAAERSRSDLLEHSERVSWMAERLARQLGACEREADGIAVAAKLHDVGRIALGVRVSKDHDDTMLTALHAVAAGDLLKRFAGLERAARWLRSQAEWYDGSGYPDHLAGDAIPLASRIIAVADAYDLALVSREGGGRDQALARIRSGAGTRFDPRVVAALEAAAAETWRAEPGTPARPSGYAPQGVLAAAGAHGGVAASGRGHWMDRALRLEWLHRISPYGDEPPVTSTTADVAPALQMIELQEGERRRIARELHDEIGGTLTGIVCMLQTLPELLAVRAAQGSVESLMARVQNITLDLRPALLDECGLAPALKGHAQRYTSLTGIRVTLECVGLDRRFASAVEATVYRIVQEALTNAAKHARISEVVVRIRGDRREVSVLVEDHGVGFDPQAVESAGAGTGLAGMRERAVLLGGSFTVSSRPGEGTRVGARLPSWTPTMLQ